MPNTSIHFPQDLLDEIDKQVGKDQSRSEWIKQAVRRELNHEHDDIDGLEQEVDNLKEEIRTIKTALIKEANSDRSYQLKAGRELDKQE